MKLAKGDDPNKTLVISKNLDVGSDLRVIAAIFGTAFRRYVLVGDLHPVIQPGLVPDVALALSSGSPDYVVHKSQSFMRIDMSALVGCIKSFRCSSIFFVTVRHGNLL